MSAQYQRLYRSQTNKVLAGVCGGLAEYLKVDTTVVRLVWVLLTLLGGSGIILYILAVFIIPENKITAADSMSSHPKSDYTAGRIFGLLFVVLGVILLLDNLDFFSFCRLWDISWEFVFPGLLILAGIFLLMKRGKLPTTQSQESSACESKQPLESPEPPPSASAGNATAPKVFRRSATDKKIFGLCGGAGEYFGIDPTIIRIAYAIFTVLSAGTGILLYLLMYLIVPEGQQQRVEQQ